MAPYMFVQTVTRIKITRLCQARATRKILWKCGPGRPEGRNIMQTLVARHRMLLIILLLLVTASICAVVLPGAARGEQAALTVSPLELTPGATVRIPVNLNSGSQAVAGLQFDFIFDSQLLSYQGVEPGSIGTGYQLYDLLSGNKVRVIVVNISDSEARLQGNGTIALLRFNVLQNAQAGQTYSPVLNGFVPSGPGGQSLQQGLPTVATYDAYGVSATSATLKGGITAIGGGSCSQTKFNYRKQGDSNWAEVGAQSGSYGIGDFSFGISGLQPDTNYEFKAMALNPSGWGHGNIKTFKTSPSTPATPSGGGGGGGGGGSSLTPPEVEKLEPADKQTGAALDSAVRVTFKSEVRPVDLGGITISSKSGSVTGVKAAVNGKTLTISHDRLQHDTSYTVYIPDRAVAGDNNVKNNQIKWSFTTVKKQEVTEAKGKCQFADVPAAHWAANVIGGLCQKGITGGYPDGTFRPENNITRAEFSVVLTRAIGLAGAKPGVPTFTDVAPGEWYYGAVEAAVKAGLVKGDGTGRFRPDELITRQEMAVIMVRAMNKADVAATRTGDKTAFNDDGDIAPWARGFVVTAVKEGLVSGYALDNTFRPGNNATRAEAGAMIFKLISVR